MNKIKIIEAGNELGLGGTEYALQLYSKYLNKEYFEVTVVAFREGGPRVTLIEELGIPVVVLNRDLKKLAELLQQTDVFHWHGYGTLDPEFFAVVSANKPKLVIQTNVFGAYKPTPLYDIIDYDLYISRMILVRRMFYDQNLPNNFALKRKVLPYPVDIHHIENLSPRPEQVQRFKEQHGLQNSFIVGRIGRADNAKFDLITLDAFAKFAHKVNNARFLLVGSTPEIILHAKELKIFDQLLILANTPNLQTLLIYYRCMDVFLAASDFGETFGMVIAEAMTAGIPVVTVSTPKKDNAQIELVDNGKTGLVVERHIDQIVDVLYYLYVNEGYRMILSAAARQKVKEAYNAENIIGSLEQLIFKHLNVPHRDGRSYLLEEYSQEMVNNYILRMSDLWVTNEQ
ncbi:Glycosyltransferase involved in cell wall bisynthesis [Pedobacter westerhofensis]|uniref:Glycosyltransferase involved in cell wall bisynthesis n=1 Tax=Pedobacter westerhofensis TaxID=425512 RepID=A0A521FTC1_9SPHI|nr:glycosyltransferase [Pedobacter westerhofensis]SMO98741.1 Glycosyltransferase involved in cell wall bisynthesis [Pedobacter westerhofensis]